MAAFILTLVVYSYFFTTIVLTNHVFPNAWVRDYPGSSTLSEGRWFNDIILQLGGGGGVQALQMSLACAVQVVNALLFAFLLRVSSRPRVFLMAAFLSLHPAILDYYSFASDHLYFVIGDSLALLGTLALDRIDDRRLSLPLATLCFLLTLATYPSKGALIGVLLVMWCILWSIGPGAAGPGRWQRLFRDRLIPAALTFGIALILFYLSSKLVVTNPSVNRTHVNDVGTVARQILSAYPEIILSFTSRVDYLPHLLRFIPALAVLVGVVAIVWQSLRANGLTLAALVLIAAIPIALQFSYIVNEDTWAEVGRILSPQAYVLLFFIAVAWRTTLLRPIATVLVAVMIYFFCIVGSQEANAAALKTIYDTAKLNRIVSRLEPILPDSAKVPVVVIGALNFSAEQQRLKRYPNRLYKAHLTSDTFAPYRQTEILNFFLGSDVMARPSQAQIDQAIASAQGRRPWPAPDSVYVEDGVVVILLQPYRDGALVTWPG